MTPFIRHMLLCDDVRPDPTRPRKVVIYGLVSTVRPTASGSYPLTTPLCVYLAMTSGRGHGTAQITVAAADTGERVYSGVPRDLAFDPDPLKVLGVVFRIPACTLPRPGLYWVELRYNGAVLAHQPLTAEEPG
ncbi:MAG: hypothetical protein U0871_05700 [Gemmataceae bacterium]